MQVQLLRITLAKNKGGYKSRKKILNPVQVEQLKERVQGGEGKTALARELGVGRETLYTYLKYSC